MQSWHGLVSQRAMDQLYRDTALVDIYDVLNASREDYDFYRRVLPRPPARVLDVGCGTGTFALDLAGLGYAVTGVDPAAQMISAARGKDRSEAVEWITGQVSDLPEAQRFDAAVMTGHAFQCLLDDTDIAALFRAVQARLRSEGAFWFETRNPAVQPWVRWMPEFSGPARRLADGRSLQVVQEVLEVKPGFVTFEERYAFSDLERPLVSRSTLRFLELDEIAHLAEANGFALAEAFGNWSGASFDADSPEIIVRLVPEQE